MNTPQSITQRSTMATVLGVQEIRNPQVQKACISSGNLPHYWYEFLEKNQIEFPPCDTMPQLVKQHQEGRAWRSFYIRSLKSTTSKLSIRFKCLMLTHANWSTKRKASALSHCWCTESWVKKSAAARGDWPVPREHCSGDNSLSWQFKWVDLVHFIKVTWLHNSAR